MAARLGHAGDRAPLDLDLARLGAPGRATLAAVIGHHDRTELP